MSLPHQVPAYHAYQTEKTKVLKFSDIIQNNNLDKSLITTLLK